MAKGKIPARIQESDDGPYYNVNLHAIPNKGDLVSLFSHVEQSDGKPPHRAYEVTRIVHDIQDVMEGREKTWGGHHSVNVFVKRVNPDVLEQ